MMQLDTSRVAGFENSTVVLEFEHSAHEPHHVLYAAAYPRCSYVRIVEFVAGDDNPPSGFSGMPWVRVSGGWEATIDGAAARCSPDDQFCRETGRRVALRRLAKDSGSELVSAALRQYFANRAALKRARR